MIVIRIARRVLVFLSVRVEDVCARITPIVRNPLIALVLGVVFLRIPRLPSLADRKRPAYSTASRAGVSARFVGVSEAKFVPEATLMLFLRQLLCDALLQIGGIQISRITILYDARVCSLNRLYTAPGGAWTCSVNWGPWEGWYILGLAEAGGSVQCRLARRSLI